MEAGTGALQVFGPVFLIAMMAVYAAWDLGQRHLPRWPAVLVMFLLPVGLLVWWYLGARHPRRSARTGSSSRRTGPVNILR